MHKHRKKPITLPVLSATSALLEVPDPFEPGAVLVRIASFRGDPLLLMKSRYQLPQHLFAAGRHWQKLFEAAQIGSLKAINIELEPVDGRGQAVEALSEVRRHAIKRLMRCAELLGERDDRLVRDVLGKGMLLIEAATARGIVRSREIEFLGLRFRQALESLAREFGYA